MTHEPATPPSWLSRTDGQDAADGPSHVLNAYPVEFATALACLAQDLTKRAAQAAPHTQAIRSAFRRAVRQGRPDLDRMTGLEVTALVAARDFLLRAVATPRSRNGSETPTSLPAPYSTSLPHRRSIEIYL